MKRTYIYEAPEIRVSSIDTCGFICVSINELDSALVVDEYENYGIETEGHDLEFNSD